MVGYMVKFIDTPGFADTGGLEADRENKKKIHEYLKKLDRIDLICFVAKSNETRLTATQHFIIGEVLTIFGKDAINNIVILFTFCDAGKPQTAGAMAEAKVPFKFYYLFNNSALFIPPSKKDLFTETYWDIGQTSMQEFFEYLRKAEGFSLTLTKDAIKERERINVTLDNVFPKLQVELETAVTLKKPLKEIEVNKDIINKNQKFTQTVVEPSLEIIPCRAGTYTTYCEECKNTCHPNCAFFRKEDKINCAAIVNEYCSQCLGKCHYTKHFHYENIIIRRTIIKEVEITEKKLNYDSATAGKSLAEKALADIQKKLQECEDSITADIKQMKGCQERLQKIALKDFSLTTTEYIRMLIQNE